MILCCGESLIDMLPRDAGGVGSFVPTPGGAVFNTAIALGRLRAPAGYYGGLSDDFLGQMLADALERAGVDATPAPRVTRPTTLAFVRLTDGQAEYAFYDENTAGRMLKVEDLPALDDTTSALFFGGISLVALPCGDAYAALAAGAGDRAVMIDPNIRPGFVTDEAAYRDRLAGMIAAADIVKLSDDDLHWLEGPGDIAALARGLLDRGPRLVCITRGAEGATGYTAGVEAFAPSRRVAVADTVGAGDTFNAGLMASLHAAGALTKPGIAALGHATLAAALDLGVRAAAVTVSRAGANPPTLDELG